MNFAYRVARLCVRGRRNCARIQDDDVGVGQITRRKTSLLAQLPLNRRAIRLRGTATELFDVKSDHQSSVNPLLFNHRASGEHRLGTSLYQEKRAL